MRGLGLFIEENGRLLAWGKGPSASDNAKTAVWVSETGRNDAWQGRECEMNTIIALSRIIGSLRG